MNSYDSNQCFDHTDYASGELPRCLHFIYTFRLISAEDTKEEEEIEEYETDEDANMEEKDESTLSSSEVIDFIFSPIDKQKLIQLRNDCTYLIQIFQDCEASPPPLK